MYKYLFLIIFCFFSFKVMSNENLLTVQQQLERLQREVTDLSKLFYSNSNNTNNDNASISNFSAIDMRIRDLEKDINNLNANLDEIQFIIDDFNQQIEKFENNINFITQDIKEVKNKIENNTQQNNISNENINEDKSDNETLGTLKIETNQEAIQENIDINQVEENETIGAEEKINLSPEDQFQLAMDSMRKKNWQEAKNLFYKFIENNSSNQLSGSAYYWLGKLHILEKNYREAVITLAEGHEKFPESMKAPDMLYDLSQSLIEIDKKNEACNIMEILIKNHPNNKLIKKANKQLLDNECLTSN